MPERKHPLTPSENVALTGAFAEEHAAALDEIRSLYFTEERFDDFYYGKGSTYPDIHGSVGILFEQASARGHLRESPHGEFDFPFTIRNQVRTSLSTLKAARVARERLLHYQKDFYRDALAKADPVKAYFFGECEDQTRMEAFLALLRRHEVEIRALREPVEADGRHYRPGSSQVVLLEQPQYRLVRALFETRTDFEDDIFYDVSTWTLPLAFNFAYSELRSLPEGALGDPLPADALNGESDRRVPVLLPEAYAYAVEWIDYLAPKVLDQLQRAGVRVSVATVPLQVTTTRGVRDLPRGTLIIPRARQGLEAREWNRAIAEAAGQSGLGRSRHRHRLDGSRGRSGQPAHPAARTGEAGLDRGLRDQPLRSGRGLAFARLTHGNPASVDRDGLARRAGSAGLHALDSGGREL